MNLKDAIGGLIHQGSQDDADPYVLAENVLTVVAQEIRAHCTPSGDAYRAGGDTLIYAVADWMEGSQHAQGDLVRGVRGGADGERLAVSGPDDAQSARGAQGTRTGEVSGLTALDNARAALAEFDRDQPDYRAELQNHVDLGVAIRALIAEHERVTTVTDEMLANHKWYTTIWGSGPKGYGWKCSCGINDWGTGAENPERYARYDTNEAASLAAVDHIAAALTNHTNSTSEER